MSELRGAESTVLPHSELPNSRNVKKGGIIWIDQISIILVGSPTELGSENASETYLLFALPYQEGTPSRVIHLFSSFVSEFSARRGKGGITIPVLWNVSIQMKREPVSFIYSREQKL